MKKAIQSIITVILTVCIIASFTAYADLKDRPWTENDSVRVINHVVYRLDGEHWEVADFFDTAEAALDESIIKIKVEESIDGKPVTEIQNMKYYYVNEEYSNSSKPVKMVYTDENEFVTEIELPETITVICHDAFNGFRSLKKINIPKGIKKIGANAFDYCSSLESLVLPSIDGKTLAVKGCESLKKVEFIGNPSSIGNMLQCYELSSISIPKSVKKLGSFEDSGLTKLAVKNTVSISKHSFMNNTKLKKFVFKNVKSVKKYVIPKEAFCLTPELTEFRMPKAKEIYINSYAFNGSGIKKISTKNVVKIGFEAFSDCKNLTEFTVPKTINSIGNRAFEDCNKLRKLYINTKNTKIINKTNAFKYLNTSCKVYVKTKAMKNAVKNSGFTGKVVVR